MRVPRRIRRLSWFSSEGEESWLLGSGRCTKTPANDKQKGKRRDEALRDRATSPNQQWRSGMEATKVHLIRLGYVR